MQRTKKGKRVFFIISSLGGGGAERVVCTLANELNNRGYEITIIRTLLDTLNYELTEGVRLIDLRLGICPSFSIKRTIIRLSRLRRVLKDLNPDIMISFTTHNNLEACLASMGMRKKLIVSERSNPKIISRFRALLCRILYPGVGAVIFQTEQARQCFGGRIRRVGRVIMNPVPDELPRYKGERTGKIVSVGRLVALKNTDMLIRAFARLSGEYPRHTLQIYGDGDKRGELEMLCQELGIAGRVRFHGFVSSVSDDIANACLYVMTSRHEGMPNALIEAMAMGIPCISTDCPSGGPAELIQSGENGLLIPVGDEDALVSAMQRVLSDGEFARKLGENALRIRERLNTERIVDQWQALIEQILEANYGR